MIRYIKLSLVGCVAFVFFPAMLSAQNTLLTDSRTGAPAAETIPARAQINSEAGSTPTENGLSDAMSAQNSDGDTIQAQEVTVEPLEGNQIQVAYRTVKERDLLGGVSYVDVPEILDKNYTTYSLANMEAFVGGFNGNLWGMDQFLILVDGVPRDATSVMPTEIAQITFLKGAAAVALYGSLAAKGVVMITTKRGVPGEKMINVRANAGIHVPKRYPKYLGSAEYMTLYNEARVNDGLSELYSEADIYHHAAGENPYRYPDVDYYSSDYLRETFSRYDATVEIAGGNERTRYYTNMGFYNEGSLLNFGQAENNKNQRFNIRGNVDMNLNSYLTAKVDAAAIYYNGVGVNADYWGGAATIRPHRYAPLIPVSMLEEEDQASWNYVNSSDHLIDGKYLLGGTQLDQTNPIADILAGGSNTFTSRQFQFNAGVNADLRNVLKGLSFSTLFGLDFNSSYNQAFNNEYAVYEPSWTNYGGDDLIGSLTKYGQDASSREQNISNSWYRQTISFSGQLNYRNSIDNRHNFSAMLIAGGFQQSISAVYHRASNANLGLHAGYNYRQKYYVDFNGAVIHSARLPEKNRQAFSPTASLGWRISEEGFLSGASSVDNLMLHVSAGILHTDIDIGDYYLYENLYRQTDGAWYTWKDGLQNQSTDSRRGANPDLDFPKRKEVSVGLDASLFDNLVVVNASAFLSEMSGVVLQNEVLFPSYFTTGWPVSSFVPYVNYNNDQRRGIDFNLKVNQRFGEVDLSLGLTGMYYTTKATKRAEIFEDEYQNQQGRPLDAIFGLENEGFFMDQAEIDNSPRQVFGEVRPGDLKYKDQNGDGIINAQDQVYLGRGGWAGAPFTGGVNLTAKWRNLTFFALGVVRTGAYATMNSDYFWVNGEDKYSEVVRGRWTEETKNTATFPRLTTQNGNNNFRATDFWLFSTDRFDLSRVQLSYTFPESVIGNGLLRELNVYVNGANLLTIAPNRELLELNIGTAPQTRFFNLGVRALF